MSTFEDAFDEWAHLADTDPKIQKDYEAALGEFLVAINRLENTASDIIVLALKKAKREEIISSVAKSSFAQRVLNLELISLHFPEIASQTLIKELRALGSERNDLAHGHFDQDPIGGSYKVVTQKKKPLDVPVKNIHQLTERAKKADQQLHTFVASYWFEDLPNEPPAG